MGVVLGLKFQWKGMIALLVTAGRLSVLLRVSCGCFGLRGSLSLLRRPHYCTAATSWQRAVAQGWLQPACALPLAGPRTSLAGGEPAYIICSVTLSEVPLAA